MRRKLSALTVGDKILVKVPQLRSFHITGDIAPYAVQRVIETSPGNIQTLGVDGEKLSIDLNSEGYIADWRMNERVASVGPFPDADDGTIVAYATPLLMNDHHDQEIAVYVTESSDGRAHGHILQFYEPRLVGELSVFDDPEAAMIVIGNALFHELQIVLDDSTGEWKSGDLLVAHGFKVEVVNGEHVTTLKKPTVLTNLETREDAGRFWPDVSSIRPSFTLEYQSVSKFLHEMGRATAALDPDAALIFVHKDGERLDHHLVSHTGALLYAWDDASDYFTDFPGEGLWVATDLKGWAYTSREGEHDAGIDYGVGPASLEDLKAFGFDEASLSHELTEMIGDGSEYSASEWIAKANEQEAEAERRSLVPA